MKSLFKKKRKQPPILPTPALVRDDHMWVTKIARHYGVYTTQVSIPLSVDVMQLFWEIERISLAFPYGAYLLGTYLTRGEYSQKVASDVLTFTAMKDYPHIADFITKAGIVSSPLEKNKALEHAINYKNYSVIAVLERDMRVDLAFV